MNHAVRSTEYSVLVHAVLAGLTVLAVSAVITYCVELCLSIKTKTNFKTKAYLQRVLLKT